MSTVGRRIGALALVFIAGCLVVFFSAELLGRAAAMPFERGTLAAWGGHAGFFGLLLSLSVLVPSAVSAFVLCWIAFHISGRAGVPEVVTASIPWLLLYMDPDVPYLNLSSGFVAAQILLGIVCVPLAIVFAARLKRRGNAH